MLDLLVGALMVITVQSTSIEVHVDSMEDCHFLEVRNPTQIKCYTDQWVRVRPGE